MSDDNYCKTIGAKCERTEALREQLARSQQDKRKFWSLQNRISRTRESERKLQQWVESLQESATLRNARVKTLREQLAAAEERAEAAEAVVTKDDEYFRLVYKAMEFKSGSEKPMSRAQVDAFFDKMLECFHVRVENGMKSPAVDYRKQEGGA